MMFSDSNTANLTNFSCRQQYTDSNGQLQSANGVYAEDIISVSSFYFSNE